MATNLEIHRTVRAITLSLDETIAFYETYVPSGQNAALIERVNNSGYHQAFNVISDALHRETILGLCRIWEKRRDTANLNRLVGDFQNQQLLADLKSAGHTVDQTALTKWFEKIEAGYQSDTLSALKRARDRALAHTATPNEPYKGNARVAIYGDERWLLEYSIPLVEEASKFIGYSYVRPLSDMLRIRRDDAERFWDSIGS